MSTTALASTIVQQVQTRAAMVEALSTRSAQEVQAALVIAKKFPRDEFSALEKIKVACRRVSLAEIAEYEYERGGTRIQGPTIDLLKAIAKRWGNIESGWQEIEREDGRSTVRAYAWDMETNARSEMTFVVRHWRDTKQGGYALKDERDIYEATANFASRRVRACLEAIIDSDIVELAVDECRKTLRGQSKEPLQDRVRQMVSAFSEYSVTVQMLEKRLGNKLEACSENQLAGLRRVFKSLKDGVGQREDFFKGEDSLVETKPPTPTQPAKTDEEAEAAMGLAPERPRRGRPPKAAATAAAAPTKSPETTPAGPQEPPDEPEGPMPPAEADVAANPQQQLLQVVEKAGYTFQDLVEWGKESGNIPDADSLPDISAVPTNIAMRLLRAQVGLLAGIQRMKGGQS